MLKSLSEKGSSRYILPVFMAWVIYASATLMSPRNFATAEKYDISITVLGLLLSLLLLPILAIWLLAVLGSVRFFEFSQSLKLKAKRKAYCMISVGLMVIALHLIVSPVSTSVFVLWGGDATNATYVIVKNYETVFATLISFSLMFAGSMKLLKVQKQKIPLLTKVLNVGVPVSLFTLLYSYLVFTNPIRQTTGNELTPATYYLSDPLIVTTIMVPVILTWTLGLALIVNMEHYSRFTKIANRRGVVDYYNGMLVIVAALIITQIVNSLGVSRTADFSLGIVLAILLVMLGLIAGGFALIARGARRIKDYPDPKTLNIGTRND